MSEDICPDSYVHTGTELFQLVVFFLLIPPPSSYLLHSADSRSLLLSPTPSPLRCSAGGYLKSIIDLNFLFFFPALHPLPRRSLPQSGATLPVITEDQRVCQRHLLVH